MSNKSVFILVMSLALIGIVTASSEYCNPSLGTDTIIESSGGWTNATIYGECPICVQTNNGLECSECEGEPTPTPTPTPTVTPTYSPTPTPTTTPCPRGIWCIFPEPIPTPVPTPERWCPIGVWCPL